MKVNRAITIHMKNHATLYRLTQYRLHSKYNYRFIASNRPLSYQTRIYKITNFNLCTSNKGENKDRYTLNHELPEKKDIKLRPFPERLIIFLIKVMLLYYLLKHFFFTKYNIISKRKVPYLINENIEIIFNDYISKRLQAIFTNKTYRTDTPEVELVYKIYTNLLKKNKIIFTKQITKDNIYIIDTPTIASFLLKNGDLFISNRIIELGNSEENEIAFFIATEIANLLMEKTTERFIRVLYDNYITSNLINKKVKTNVNRIPKLELPSYLREKESFINDYVLFYPESKTNTYFEEIDMCRVALKLLNAADYELNKVFNCLKYLEYSDNEKV
jgi:hypothetical protein